MRYLKGTEIQFKKLLQTPRLITSSRTKMAWEGHGKKSCKQQMLINDLQPFQQWSNMKKHIHKRVKISENSNKISSLILVESLKIKVSTSECYRSKWETSKGWKMISTTSNHEDFSSRQHSEPVVEGCFIEKLPLVVLKNI